MTKITYNPEMMDPKSTEFLKAAETIMNEVSDQLSLSISLMSGLK